MCKIHVANTYFVLHESYGCMQKTLNTTTTHVLKTLIIQHKCAPFKAHTNDTLPSSRHKHFLLFLKVSFTKMHNAIMARVQRVFWILKKIAVITHCHSSDIRWKATLILSSLQPSNLSLHHSSSLLPKNLFSLTFFTEHISHSWAFPWRLEYLLHFCAMAQEWLCCSNSCGNWLWIKASTKLMRWKFHECARVHARVSTHQALALLAVLHPCVPAAVGEQAILVQTLAAQSRVALGAAEQVGVRVVAVTNHPAAHHLASLSSVRAKTYQTSTIKHWAQAWTHILGCLCDGIIKHAC